MLQTTPDLRGRIALIQIAVPSRDDVPAYLESRRTVEELVGRINGQFGQPGHQPIHYVTRPFTQEQVFALYRLVDVMVVTPLRDGMNLVAKEFVASRHDESGVLVLSEFAGAAAELGEAVQVNPYDIDGTAEGLRVAITMGASERSARMKALRARVAQFDATSWTRGFLDILRRPADAAEKLTFIRAGALAEHVPRDRRLVLFLDYDGTLYPIVRIPQLAAPDKALLALLERLAKYERCEVHIVSGRPGSVMEAWFGHLRLHLHAEHGAMSKAPSANDWQVSVQRSGASNWQSFVRPVLEEVVRNTPGSFIEEKVHSLAWHYRMADPVHADRTANELRLHGRETFAPLGVELITGKRVIEVRQVGANKGSVIGRVLETIGDSPFAVAIGDDTTDEDMFMAVSGRGIGIVVGDRPSKAEARLRDHAEVRRFLELIAAPGEARA
jgi:trehalose 6-phosphate synthase/phosphatase